MMRRINIVSPKTAAGFLFAPWGLNCISFKPLHNSTSLSGNRLYSTARKDSETMENMEHPVQKISSLFGVVSSGEKYVDLNSNEKQPLVGTDIAHQIKGYDKAFVEGSKYFSPDEYYSRQSYKVEPWSELEEAALVGIGSTFSYAGGWRVFKPDTVDTYILYENGWKVIKNRFDSVIRKWALANNVSPPPDRSWQELALHSRVKKGMTWCDSNRYLSHDTMNSWHSEYNRGNTLFNPNEEFRKSFRENCALLNQDFENIRNQVMELYNSATQNRSWSEKEETILLGVTEDHTMSYVLRGGSAYSVNMNTTHSRRVAASMKRQYDLAWKNAIKNLPEQFSSSEYIERDVNELRDQYTLIKYRTVCKLKQDLADNTALACKWYELNKDGKIINSRIDSLANKD